MSAEWVWLGLWLVASFLISLLSIWAGVKCAALPLRRSPDAPWYERARLAYPAQILSVLSYIPNTLFLAAGGLVLAGDVGSTHEVLFGFAGMLGAIFAVGLVRFRLSRWRSGPRLTFGYWLSGLAVFWSLHLSHVVVFGAVIIMSPAQFSGLTILVLVLGAIAMLLLMNGASLYLLRLLGLLTTASPRLARITAATIERLGIVPKGTYEVRWPTANAWVIQWPRRVLVSDSAMLELDDAQLDALLAHELAHLSEPRRAVMLRSLAPMMFLGLATAIVLSRTFGFPVLLIAAVVFFFGSALIRRMSRRLEKRADAIAAVGQGTDLNYARVLELIYRSNQIPLVTYFRGGTHPHAYDRLLAAGLQPDFPRPKAPALAPVFIGFFISTLIAIVLPLIILMVTHRASPEKNHENSQESRSLLQSN